MQRNGNSCIFTDKFINKLVVFQFDSGKIFNIIFLRENKDNIQYCNVDRLCAPPWIGLLQTTDYCVRMVIVLSSTDKPLIQAHEYSKTPNREIRSFGIFMSLNQRFICRGKNNKC